MIQKLISNVLIRPFASNLTKTFISDLTKPLVSNLTKTAIKIPNYIRRVPKPIPADHVTYASDVFKPTDALTRAWLFRGVGNTAGWGEYNKLDFLDNGESKLPNEDFVKWAEYQYRYPYMTYVKRLMYTINKKPYPASRRITDYHDKIDN